MYKYQFVQNKKYRTDTTLLASTMPYDYKTSICLTLLTYLMDYGNSKIKSADEMVAKKEELYALEFYLNHIDDEKYIHVNIQIISLNEKMVDEKDLYKKCLTFVKDTVFNVTKDKTREENLAKAKKELLTKIKYTKNTPGRIATINLYKQISEECLEYRTFNIDEKIIESITLDDMNKVIKELKKLHYVPFYVGPNNVEEMYEKIKDVFNTKETLVTLATERLITDKKIDVRVEKAVEQSTIFMLYSYNDKLFKNRTAMTIFNFIVGDGGNNILFNTIREKMGLCYSIFSSFSGRRGLFSIALGVDKENIDKAIEAIKTTIDNLIITKEMLMTAKTSKSATYDMYEDHPFGYLLHIYHSTLNNRPIDPKVLRNELKSLNLKDMYKIRDSLQYIGCSVVKGVAKHE